jgi:predicted short-subunit dehydrogenase-like oxidoreductase (DUF2520 family)
MTMPGTFWIVGPGRMGLSLGSVLVDSGLASGLLLVGRRRDAPKHAVLAADIVRYSSQLTDPPPPGATVILAVPDGSIGTVALELAELGRPDGAATALHLSGARPAEVLAPLADRGYAVGSLHPLQTVADPRSGANRLRNAFFTFEGDRRAREAAAAIVGAAGGRMLEVEAANKARYHAACVFASNYVVTCAAVATRLLSEAVGISRDEAVRALQPLWGGAVANLDDLGLPAALTGPVARGDVETMKDHLASLDGDTRELYGALALQALALSRELGLDAEVAERIEAEIRGLNAGG